MAGYSGCGGSAKITNVLNDTTAWSNGYPGVAGYEGGVDTFPVDFTSPLTDQDAVVIRRGDTDNRFKVSEFYNNASAVIDLDVSDHGIDTGSILIIADASCSNVGIFQHTGNNPDKVGHNTGNSVSPGNCHKNLTFGRDCSDTPASNDFGEKYGPGSSLMTVTTRAMYISNNSQGVPALYMKAVGSSGGLPKEELVEGVEGMQLSYGVDFDSNGEVDRFQTADNVADWDSVKSVRVQLLMRSINTVGGGDISVDFNGQTYTDSYMRQVASSTVMLRNR